MLTVKISTNTNIICIRLKMYNRYKKIKVLFIYDCSIGKDSRESLGLQGNPTSPS